MAQFLSDDELRQRGGEDVVEYVQGLRAQVETHKARAEAAIINAEQACSLVEQKFLSLTEQFGILEHEKRQCIATLERRSTELAEAHGKAHKLELDAIKHGSDLERLSFELGELRKSKRELLEVVEQKNLELDEKNASIKAYLDKIVQLTNERSNFEGKLREHDISVVRSSSLLARLQQEKELLEQHNSWLNEELTAKVKGLIEERRISSELGGDLQSKLAQADKHSKELSEALQRSKERVGDLEAKLAQTREELRFTKEQAALYEDHSTAELATATKLADLYKASADDWSSKSNELEGVIKAMETHLNQVESNYREKLDKEIEARESLEKEAAELKDKLNKAISDKETDSFRDADVLALSGSLSKTFLEAKDRQVLVELHGNGAALPLLGVGISGTALAAALLRDGWSLSTMYSKYQEAVDAWRHEKHERKNSQTLLERVLREIEMKAEVILDERAEHTRMMESYQIMEEKLYYCMQDQSSLENSIKDLKADLRRKERDVRGTQKEISDLQVQVAGLLKECAEVKQTYESGDWKENGNSPPYFVVSEQDKSAADVVITEKLVTFKDIKGMVEQNSQLRILVRDLAHESEQKEAEMKEVYSAELDKRAEAAAKKVAEVLQHYKEKEELVEVLQGTVAMYKRLYEEELKSRYNAHSQPAPGVDFSSPDDGGKDYRRLLQTAQEDVRTVREEAATNIKSLEEELAKAKLELTNARIERARVVAEGELAREQMTSLTLEAENRRKEMDGVLARNIEFSQTITNYQQRLRESSQKLHTAEELANKLKIEASILEKEKELLASAEKRASDEVASLSDRTHRLQASLDTLQSIKEVQEDARSAEMKKLQDDWSHMQKEWTESRKELEVERRHSRDLIVLRDKAVKEAMDRVETVSKELANALKTMYAAETRAQVSELRCSELETSLKKADDKIAMALAGGKRINIGDKSSAEIDVEILANLHQAREEVEQVKEDLAAAKGHAEQYKRIAEANEDALNQLEAAHKSYREDVEHMKQVMEAEIQKFKEKVANLELDFAERELASASRAEEKEVALVSAQQQITSLQESLSSSRALLQENEMRVTTLKKEVDKYHHQWRDAQQNYERQILLQANTIRELTSASERLTKLEDNEAALQIQAETAEAQLASLQVSWAMEKSTLESEKKDAEKKWKDLEEQNRLLLDRMEAMHITSVEHARKASVGTGDNEAPGDKEESDLQNVLRYLRRSKETAETEVSLLKQERLRLQKQLDAALHAAEDAQSTLRREQENARTSLYSGEEFKSLQAQVREINLLRESNAQLREENRRNFEDSRESRDKVRQAYAELEPVRQQLRERELEQEASEKEIEIQKAETKRWQGRVSQLLEKYKAIDVEDYQRVKAELLGLQEHVKKIQDELEAEKREAEIARKELNTARQKVEAQQNEVNETTNRLNEQDKKLLEATQAETTTRADLEKFKRHAHFQKRKIDNLTKEKDDLSKENEAISKQIEELKTNAGKRVSIESRQETARQEATLRQESAARLEQAQKESESLLKERETRIQTLEKSLERERESLRKEKHLRQRDQKTFYDVAQKAVQAKKDLLEEFETFKRETVQVLEQKLGNGAGIAEPSLKTDIDDKAATYVTAVNVISEVADNVLNNIAQLVPAPIPVSATPVVLQSSGNIPEAPQPLPVLEASATLVDTPAAAATIVFQPNTAPPTGSASVLGIIANMPGSTSSSVSISSTLTPPVTRSTIRAASSVPPTTTRPPLRQPPAQTAVPDQRERDIAQLRAQIQEKEKTQAQASVTQARKTARRLIRPKIEPDVTTDLGDPLGEGTVDVTETDMEPEEAKLPAVSIDTGELASSSMSSLQVTMIAPTALDLAAVNVSTAAGQPVVSGRKRPAATSESVLVEEVPIDPAGKSENSNPQKKPRAVELSPEEISQEVAPSSSIVAVGGSFQVDSISHHGGQDDHSDLEVYSEINTVPSLVLDSSIPVTSISDYERERPATEISDVPRQKRHRFIRSEVPLLLHPVSLKDQAVAGDETTHEKMVMESDDPVHGTDPNKQIKGETEFVGQGNTTNELLNQNQNVDIEDLPSSGELSHGGHLQASSDFVSVHGIAQEDTVQVTKPLNAGDAPDISQVGSDGGPYDMVPEQLNLKEDTQPLSSQILTGTDEEKSLIVLPEFDIAMGDPGVQQASLINTEASGPEEIQEGEDEAEEGEIPTDAGIPERILETILANELVTRDNNEVIMDVVKDVDEGNEANPQHTVPPCEQNVADSATVLNTESNAAEQSDINTTTLSLEGNVVDSVDQEQRTMEEQPMGSSTIVTRQLLKIANNSSNTTINLADRAKERAAVRRGALNPQSPVARGRGRAARGGNKRAPGASRGGRVISTGVRGRGQTGANTGATPEVTRVTQQLGSSGQTDQSEANSTPNPHETLPREGGD